MGSFYGSVQVRSDDREQILRAAEQVARERGQKCLIGPLIDGWIGIYPDGNGQDQGFGEAMAAQVGGDVLHLMVHDDDITACWWWRQGKLLDAYWSTPGYFGEEDRQSDEARTGQPELLAQLAGGKTEELRRILARDERKILEGERLRKLASALGIRNALTAYEYLKAGERKGISDWRQFVELPRGEADREKEAQRNRRRQINASLKRMKTDNLLLLREVGKRRSPRVARAGDGFLVLYHGWGKPTEIKHYSPPWQAGADLSITTDPSPMSVAADQTGDRIAMAGKSFTVWSAAGWQKLVEVPVEDWGHTLAMSEDGKLLACGSRERTLVVEVDGGRTIATLPGHAHGLAFHPSNHWLVTGKQIALRITPLLSADKQERDLFVGGRYQEPAWAQAARAQAFRDMQDEAKDAERVRSTFQAMEKQLQAMAKRANKLMTEEQLAAVRANAEKSMKDFLAMVAGGPPAPPSRGNEDVVMGGFSSDGWWFWCGTNHGLRVYKWEQVAAAKGEDMPVPVFSYDTAGASRDFGLPMGHISAAVEEPGGGGLLFGGLSGRLYRMDLGSGQVRELMAMPEGEAIATLVLSRDAKVLGIVSSFVHLSTTNQRDDRDFWSLWSYEKLCEMASPFRG